MYWARQIQKHLQHSWAWLLPWVTAVPQLSSTETATQDDTSGRLVLKEMIFLSILIAEIARRGISDLPLQ